MNKPIRTMAVFCMLLFLALLGNATWLQYFQASSLNDRPENHRVIEAAFSRERGPIIVGREAVAESKESDDQYHYQRVYPRPLQYAHLTGWLDLNTQWGIEKSENQVLSGDDSRLFVNRLVDLLSNAEPEGGSVTLTIDAAAQRAAYEGIKAGLAGSHVKASVVAIEPSTGKILAMVSVPTFDPNELASHDVAKNNDNYESLNEDPDQPLLNRAIRRDLPPGSVFKLVTAAAAMEEFGYNADSQVPAGPTYRLPNSTKVIDNEGRSCGTTTITLTQALEQSCNTTFLQLAVKVGGEKMLEQAEAFGFNETSLDDLYPGEVTSSYPETMIDDPAQVALSGMGQASVRATPLQMAMVAAAVANHGVVMKPYVVDTIRSPERDVLDETDPEELSVAMQPSTALELTRALVSVVQYGTGTPAQIPGVEVAGKTGTAQTGDPSKAPYAWFVSFAPASDPKVAVAVMIEEADGIERGEIHGGLLGGPIAKAVMEAVLNQ